MLLLRVDEDVRRKIDDHVVAILDNADAPGERGAAKLADPERRQVRAPLSAVIRTAELGERARQAGKLSATFHV